MGSERVTGGQADNVDALRPPRVSRIEGAHAVSTSTTSTREAEPMLTLIRASLRDHARGGPFTHSTRSMIM